MKICTRCKKSKDIGEFAKQARSKDGYSVWCKECFAENAASKYKSNAEERQRKARNRDAFRNANQQNVMTYLQGRSCMDCGNADWRVLEFDHRDPSVKAFNIAAMYYSHSWHKILLEIEKCDVVCANCHRIRTATQFGTWRSFDHIGL